MLETFCHVAGRDHSHCHHSAAAADVVAAAECEPGSASGGPERPACRPAWIVAEVAVVVAAVAEVAVAGAAAGHEPDPRSCYYQQTGNSVAPYLLDLRCHLLRCCHLACSQCHLAISQTDPAMGMFVEVPDHLAIVERR